MSLKRFTVEQIEKLQQNPNVKSVSDKGITYKESFKEYFIIESNKGKSSVQIFEESGFEVNILGLIRIYSSGKRFRNQSKRLEGLKDTRKGGSGRPRTRDLTDAEIIARQKAQIELLKQERDFLLELKRLERQAIKKETLSRKKSMKSSNK